MNAEREAIMCRLERLGENMWKQGTCDDWLLPLEEEVKGIVRDVNGKLLFELGCAVHHNDVACVELLRNGAPLYGLLEVCGNGPAKDVTQVTSLETLYEGCQESNEALLNSLRAEPYEKELHELTLEDARLGRMTYPIAADRVDCSRTKLHPRFAVEQGLKPNGDTKIRAVDNMSWSHAPGRTSKKRLREQSVNGCSAIPEKVQHDHVDDLAEGMATFMRLMKEAPALVKADISAAFRRVPLFPGHRWAAGVAYMAEGQAWVAWHIACMFGAASSVYNWERIGALLAAIIVGVLKICLFRYVDDMFAPEREASMQHAMGCITRIIRLLMGPTSVEDRKVECGRELVILGVSCIPSAEGMSFFPDKAKVDKCLKVICEALESGIMHAGVAQKLAGRLSWAQTHMFHKLGRAMLRPIFNQRLSKVGRLGKALRVALEWWKQVLATHICEIRPWSMGESPPVHVFVDARGTPPRCAAVTFLDGHYHYTDGKPSDKVMNFFRSRNDAQICGLEMLAIAVGLSTYADELKGRKVIVHSDNVGAEAATTKGTAKEWDHCQIVHEIWTMVSMCV